MFNYSRTKNSTTLKLLVAAFLFVLTLGTAAAQSLPTPTTSTLIAPPEGATAFAVGHAFGTQGYVCLPTPTGFSFTVNNARPEATLFATIFGRQVQFITHFLSPNTNPNKFAPPVQPFGNATWQSSFDTSKAWAQVSNSVKAGPDQPNCTHSNSIACLLLQVVGSQDGPTGGKFLSKTTFIQRLNTNGGLAPTEGCAAPGDVGKQALVPYTADYFFYRGGVDLQ